MDISKIKGHFIGYPLMDYNIGSRQMLQHAAWLYYMQRFNLPAISEHVSTHSSLKMSWTRVAPVAYLLFISGSKSRQLGPTERQWTPE